MRAGFRRGVAMLLAGLCAWPLAAPAAVDEADLLPVEQAFALSTSAPDRQHIRIRFDIADGYYLYRHRTAVRAEGFSGELQLPEGRRHVDEFFGEVETYRGELAAVLEGHASPGASAVTLQVDYQGCADAGVCYPPQTTTVTVPLPAAGGGADGLSALGRALGAGGGNGLLPGAVEGRGAPLPAAQAFGFEAIADDGDTILMRFTPAPGYYLYRDRSSFTLDGGAGVSAGTPQWPRGIEHHDEHFGDVVVYFDPIDVPLPVHRQQAGATTVELTATFQGCQDEGICYPPMTRTVRLELPAGTVAPSTDAAAVTDGASADQPTPPTDTGPADVAAPTADDADGDGTDTARPLPAPAMGAAADDNAVRSRPPVAARTGMAAALLLALLGGIVLNLMPCVLPILSLKVLGVVQGNTDRAAARRHALWYTAGVLASFAAIGLLVLALRAGGQALGWGFQLQQPWFVAALVYVIFAVGLSLSGVFTLGAGLGNVGSGLAARSGPAGDFFTGVLACVVASPCIAPFMGTALAFAFTAPAPVALAVFLALGLGLALPFLLIGFVPALADRLPRPGGWMETLKQVLAFPMYLAAVWLVWVLGRQRGVDAMALVTAGLAVFALGLWWYERQRWRGASSWRFVALALVLASLLPLWGITRIAPPAAAAVEEGVVAWSEARLQALRDDHQVVFVNMTADWCVTCKANERNVLSSQAFRDALEAAGATYMVGDWTNVDPAIGAFLERHGAVGVPLYVVYPRNGGEGEVLPALLSQDAVAAALQRATR